MNRSQLHRSSKLIPLARVRPRARGAANFANFQPGKLP
jgi:hypothetical protein